MTRLIDADDFFRTFPELAIEPYINAPTVEERSQGEWIKGREISREMIYDKILHIDYENFTCSNCGLILDDLLYYFDGSPFYKYCPNCGADMREADNDKVN